jgi:hypothetical protein
MRLASILRARWPLLLVLLSPRIAAADVVVTVQPAGGNQLAAALGIELASIETQLAAELETAFNVLEPGEYVRALADAQAFSNKGLGVDYASNPTLFVAGVAGNFAMALGDEGLGERYEERPVIGAAPNVSVMAGLNLGIIGADWLTLYGNFFAQDAKIKEMSGALFNYGVHAQIKFFRPEGDAAELLFQWGGFDLTTGFAYSRLALELEKTLDTPVPLSGADPSVSAEANFAGTGTFNITTTAMTVPIELTTNIRFLYLLSLFVGVGYDVQLGNGEMEVDLDGNLSAQNPLDSSAIDLGTATVQVTEESKPSPGQLRLLAGLQVNVSMVKVFVQVNAIPDSAVSAGAGVRLAW